MRPGGLDRSLERYLGELHDCLWSPGWRGDEEALRRGLREGARALDAHVGANGRLLRNAEALLGAWGEEGAGEALFELLEHTYELAAAAEALGRGDHRGAARRAARAAESASIGVCVNAGCFELVEAWEGGQLAWEAYTAKLAGVLEGKGIALAGPFRALLDAATALARAWPAGASGDEEALAARAALASAAWCVVAAVAVRRPLGRAPRFDGEDLAAVVGSIVAAVPGRPGAP